MSTTTSVPRISPRAAAVATIARLRRDLDELQRASAGANTLPADDTGHMFDAVCSLTTATAALTNAIAQLQHYAAEGA